MNHRFAGWPEVTSGRRIERSSASEARCRPIYKKCAGVRVCLYIHCVC